MNIGDTLKIITQERIQNYEERSYREYHGFQFSIVSTRSERRLRGGREWYEVQCSRCGTRGTITVDMSLLDEDIRRREFWLDSRRQRDIEAWLVGHRIECLVRFGNTMLQTSPPVSASVTVAVTATAPLRPRAVFPEGVETGRTRGTYAPSNMVDRAARSLRETTRRMSAAQQRVKVKRKERLREKHNVEIIENDIRMIRND